MRLESVHVLLEVAMRSRSRIRLHLDSSEASEDRPTRIVEGLVIEVADGRDGRERVRLAIPTGAGDPVEVRVLLERIERAEMIASGQTAQRASTRPVAAVDMPARPRSTSASAMPAVSRGDEAQPAGDRPAKSERPPTSPPSSSAPASSGPARQPTLEFDVRKIRRE